MYTAQVYLKGHQMRTCIFLGCSDASFLPCFKLKKVEGEGGFLFFVFVSLEQHCFLYHSCRVTVFFFFFVLGKGKKKELHWQLEHSAVY